MSPGDERSRPTTDRLATNNTLPTTVPDTADITQEPARLPCRTRGCRGTRPLVPVGSSYQWDRCYRCAHRVIHSRPYPVPDERVVADPWAERVYEVLELTEGRCAA